MEGRTISGSPDLDGQSMCRDPGSSARKEKASRREIIDISQKPKKSEEEKAAWISGVIEQLERSLKSSASRGSGKATNNDLEM